MERFDHNTPVTKDVHTKGFRRILLVDFDGVLHLTVKWQGPEVIDGPAVPGAIDWLVKMILTEEDGKRCFDVQIYSSRSAHSTGAAAMKGWLLGVGFPEKLLEEIRFPTDKPPAWMTIDDRGFQFRGLFPTAEYLLRFQPWQHGYDAVRDYNFRDNSDGEFLRNLVEHLDASVITTPERKRLEKIAHDLIGHYYEHGDRR
jgi:hypothetical protein